MDSPWQESAELHGGGDCATPSLLSVTETDCFESVQLLITIQGKSQINAAIVFWMNGTDY